MVKSNFSCSVLLAHACKTPSDQKYADATAEEPRIRPERTGGDDIHQQDPHSEDLCEPTEIVECVRQPFFRLRPRPPVAPAGGTLSDPLEIFFDFAARE